MRTPDRFHPRLLALVLLATACSTDQTTPTQDSGIDPAETAAIADAAQGANVQLSSLHGRIRLYQSSCATDFAITDFVPVMGPDGPVLGPDGQPIPARVTVDITGPCTLAHFGPASLKATQLIVYAPDGSSSLHGEFHYTLAGGDVLNTVFDGAAGPVTDPTALPFGGWERFTGGTGRFVDARGGAKAKGIANLVAGKSVYRTLGVIGY